MDQTIEFSIIMPVWNRADVVARSIESVLRQTYDNFELIIVDDGSSDNLWEAVSPYTSEKVIFHRIPHSGVCAARNFALNRARGKYIAYLDSDNTWYPNFLSVMSEALNCRDESKKAAYCKCNFYKVIPFLNLPLFESYQREGFQLS